MVAEREGRAVFLPSAGAVLLAPPGALARPDAANPAEMPEALLDRRPVLVQPHVHRQPGPAGHRPGRVDLHVVTVLVLPVWLFDGDALVVAIARQQFADGLS